PRGAVWIGSRGETFSAIRQQNFSGASFKPSLRSRQPSFTSEFSPQRRALRARHGRRRPTQGGDPVETTVYLIVVDGLRADFGRRYFAGINRWLKEGKAAYTTLRSGLPSDSRPSYALIATGVDGSVNTITSNGSRQRCPAPNIFGLARQKGLRTGGAMYHWWSELFNKTPFDPATDHRQYDLERDIQDGYFYNSDETPDEVIFAKAREIRAHSRPHLLVIHSMSVDYAGDNLGGAASAT